MKALKNGKAASLGKAACLQLFLFFPRFLAAAFTRQSFLGAPFFAGLQVEGVPLDLLDDVFLLYLALKTPKGVFQRFSFLKSYFRQTYKHPRFRVRL